MGKIFSTMEKENIIFKTMGKDNEKVLNVEKKTEYTVMNFIVTLENGNKYYFEKITNINKNESNWNYIHFGRKILIQDEDNVKRLENIFLS